MLVKDRFARRVDSVLIGGDDRLGQRALNQGAARTHDAGVDDSFDVLGEEVDPRVAKSDVHAARVKRGGPRGFAFRLIERRVDCLQPVGEAPQMRRKALLKALVSA